MLMLFIILNQFFQAELGFIPIRGADGFSHELSTDYWEAFYDVNWKNTSYIYGPDLPDPIGKVFAIFCPDFFKTVPVGPYAGQEKYWPWFWMIFPAFILITPLAFGVSMIFDHKNFAADVKAFSFKKAWTGICEKASSLKAKLFSYGTTASAECACSDAESKEDTAEEVAVETENE